MGFRRLPIIARATGVRRASRVALLCLLCAVAFQVNATTGVREWRFDVTADGIPIGTIKYVVREENRSRTAESDMHFRVRLVLLDAYRYDHHATETWRDDCLSSLDTKTEERGNATTVTGHVEPDHFVVDGADGRSSLPTCVMTFAYWNPRVLEQSHLVNTQTGAWTPVSTEKLPAESITVRGHPQTAHHYRLRTPKNKIELWYSDAGEWLAMRTTTNSGHVLSYQLD